MKKTIFSLVYLLIINSFFFVDDGICQWVQSSNGLGTDKYINCLVSNGGNIFAGTWGSGVFVSSNNGANWSAANSGLSNLLVFSLAASNNNIFAGTESKIYKSINNGGSWSLSANGMGNTGVNAIFFSGTDLFAGTNNGIYMSTDYGTSWIPKNNALTSGIIRAFAVSGSNIFAGSYSGGVYKSTNNGGSWTAVNSGLTNLNVMSFSVSGTRIFAGTAGGIFVSTNNGAAWSAVNSGITNSVCYTFALTGVNLFAGTDIIPSGGSIFLTTNNGSNWTQMNQGFATTPLVSSLLISNGYLIAGTGGSSVWRRPLSEMIGIRNTGTEIPESFSLSQNYPNPFNPNTIIGFQIPVSVNTVLKVYDITGKEVAALVNQSLKPGSYEVTFDGSNLPSGIYFYSLTAGKYSETKKLTLLK